MAVFLNISDQRVGDSESPLLSPVSSTLYEEGITEHVQFSHYDNVR